MRELKFRAWHDDHGEMVYTNSQVFYEKRSFGLFVFDVGFSHYPDPKEWNVMQYTGLKDKNGKEIYEGDIVTAWSQGYCGKFEIKWREDGGGMPCWLLYPAWKNREMWYISASREEDGQVYDRGLEIIGNIWENPGLMGVQNG